MTTTKTPTVGHTRGANGSPPPPDPDEVAEPGDVYLAAADVADVLGVHRTQAWRLMSSGTIPGVVDLSAGGERATLRIRRSALMAWIDSRAL